MDVIVLSETLRKERQFVQRVLDDVKETNNKISGSLNGLHLKSWQNYQLSCRVTAGTVFIKSASVDWPLIMQHLKQVSLVNARKVGELEENHLSTFISFLRSDGKFMSDLLYFVQEKGLDLPLLIRDMFSTIYGQLLLPEDARVCQELIKTLSNQLVERCGHPKVLLQGHESLFSIVFTEYSEHEMSMKTFLSYALKSTVIRTVAESCQIMEVDVFKAVLALPEKERAGLDVDGESESLKRAVDSSVAWAQRKLKGLCSTLLKCLSESLTHLPRFAIELLHQLSTSVSQKWNLSEDDPILSSIVATCILDVMIVPTLVNPDHFGIVPSSCLEQHVRYNLTQLASALHMVPKVMEAKGEQELGKLQVPVAQIILSMDLVPLSNAISNVMRKGKQLASALFNEEMIPLIPGLKRQSVLATPDQLIRLVSLCVYGETWVPDRPEMASFKDKLMEITGLFSSGELISENILPAPYGAESTDTSSTGVKTKESKKFRGARKKSGSFDALSPPKEVEKQLMASISKSGKHKRYGSATLKTSRPHSPSQLSTDSSNAYIGTSDPGLVTCTTCGLSHDLLVIPLDSENMVQFDEFNIMSEQKYMEVIQKKKKSKDEREVLKLSLESTLGHKMEEDAEPSPKPSKYSPSKQLKEDLSLKRTSSLGDLRSSGSSISGSPPLPVPTVLEDLYTDFDLEPLRRTCSDATQYKKRSSNIVVHQGSIDPADLLGASPSPQAITNLVTLSIDDFRAQQMSVTQFKKCGLFATLKWKLRLSLAKLPGSALPLTQSDWIPSPNIVKTPASSTSGKTTKDVLLWILHKAACGATWYFRSEDSTGSFEVLYTDILRWMDALPEDFITLLLENIQEEYSQRAHYIAYLVSLQQTLLDARTRLREMTSAIQRDWQILKERCLELSVSAFMDSRKKPLRQFVVHMEEIELMDERCAFLERTLDHLTEVIQKDQALQSWTDREGVLNNIESHVLALIQNEIFYPNEDLDKARDDVFSHYLEEITDSVTLNHESLLIPKVYHADAPWSLAQEKLSMMNVVRTPSRKLQCVCDCCKSIMSTLQQSRFGSPAGADEIFPILVYIIIKSNPPNLLSTVQFVNNFMGHNKTGESAYWWTQFTSAIEFAKTLSNKGATASLY